MNRLKSLMKKASKEDILEYIKRVGYEEIEPGIWEMKQDNIRLDATGNEVKVRLLNETDDKLTTVNSVDSLINWYEDKLMNEEI